LDITLLSVRHVVDWTSRCWLDVTLLIGRQRCYCSRH